MNQVAKLKPRRAAGFTRSTPGRPKKVERAVVRSPAPKLTGVPLPAMTPQKPGERPMLQAVGQPMPPKVAGELRGRRHAYVRDGQAVRFKIKKTKGAPWIDFYRVVDPETGREGWQAQKPEGYVPCPYVGSLNPFDPDVADDAVFWPEGEKDVDTLTRAGLPAFTFGSASDVPDGCGELLAGRDVVILPDNDSSGAEGIRRKLVALADVAARVRVVDFSDLGDGDDVTDWMEEGGGTIEALWQRVEASPDIRPGAAQASGEAGALAAEPPPIPSLDEFRAKGFVFDGDTPPAPPRYIVKPLLPATGVGILGGQSGAGKTFMAIELANCLAQGRDFFGYRVAERVGTLIVAAEGAATLENRINAVRKAKGGGHDQPIVRREKVPNLSDPEQVLELQRWIRALDVVMRQRYGVRLGLIVIDTLIAGFGLQDENSSAEAQRVITHMQMLGEPIGAFVLAVHHYGKDETTGLRGSSAYRAGADVVLSLLAERNQGTGEVKARSLNKAKLRDGEEGRVAGFTLDFVALGEDDDGDPFGACVVEPDLAAAAPAAPPFRKDPLPVVAFREAFNEVMIACGREVPVRGAGPMVRAITLDEMRDEFRRRYTTVDTDEAKASATVRQALKRAVDSCPKHGFLTAEWGGQKWFWRTTP
ncbi:AAA family ATPase [Methylobacterium oryzae]|uniref:AAA family ATPase n=1 Tax=Methylobacterium oryzae TaxID=334852 RepID=UPI002F356B37